MDATHRKIELQSPSDLAFLTTQLRTAALAKLNLHLPPVAHDTEPDELRRNVEVLVDQFVASIIAGMRRNISINGMDVVQDVRGEQGDAMDGVQGPSGVGVGDAAGETAGVEKEEFEVFDEKLRAKLASTIAKRDHLIARISAQRRSTAASAAAAWQQNFERENEALAQEQARGLEALADSSGGDLLDVQIKRVEEVGRNWERAVMGLERLNKGLPETRARLERCGDVVGYLGAKEVKS